MSPRTAVLISMKTNEMFQSIADSIHRVTRLPVSIWIPDERKKKLHIIASVGLPKSYIRQAVLDLEVSSVTGDAFKTGRIQKVKDIDSDDRWRLKKQAKAMNWTSAICVPIKAEDSSIGVISVYAYTDRDITEAAHILPDFSRLVGLTLASEQHEETRQRMLDVFLKLQSVTDDPAEVLKEIVRNACELTGASSAVVYPFNGISHEFYDVQHVAQYGFRGKSAIPEKPRHSGGMAAQVIEKKEVVVSDIEKDCPPEYVNSPFIQKNSIRAFMGLSLQKSKNLLGVLYVNFDAPHRFTSQEKDTLRLFAHQAFNALNKARLYQRARRQISALEDLQEVGAALTSVQSTPENLRDILTRIAETAQRVLNADLVDLYQYDQNRDLYDLPPVQVGVYFDRTVPKIEIHKDDVIYKIVKRKKPVYFPEAQKSNTLTVSFTVKRPDAPSKRFVERENILSTAAIPLMIESDVVGVLFANYRTRQDFSNEQKKLAEVFAHQAAIAIWNARVFTSLQLRLEERLSDISAFGQIYEKMYSSNQDQLMSLIANTAAKITSAKYGVVWLSDNDGKQLKCVGVAGDDRPASMLPELLLNEESINGWVMFTGKPYLCNDIKLDEHYQNWYKDAHSELAVPMLYDEHPIGTLDVESTQVDNFTPDHVELLKTLATQAAIAIQNAKIVKKLDTLDDVGRALTATIHMQEEEILDLLYREASGLMDTDNMYIALYDERTGIVRFGLAYVAGKKIDIEKDPAFQPRKAGQGKTEEIIRTKKPIFHATRAESLEWYEQQPERTFTAEPLPSWMGVPMAVGAKVLGGIATYHPTREFVYTLDDLSILGSLANQAAIALDNAHMFHVTNRKLESLVKFQEKITSDIQLGQQGIVELLYSEAKALMDTDNMYIALYDESTDIVRFGLAHVNGVSIDLKNHKDWQPRKTGQGRTEEIIRTKKPILISTWVESKNWYDQPGRKEYIGNPLPSWIGVPMEVGGKVLGVIATYHPTKEYVYSGDDLDILQSMASQAAIALDNARAYENAGNLVLDLFTIEDIVRSINTRVGAEDLLQTIVTQLQQHLECTHCAIFFPEKVDDETVLLSKYTYGIHAPDINHLRFKPGQGIAGWVFRNGESILALDACTDLRFMPSPSGDYEPRSLLVVPIKKGKETIGVISADHRAVGGFDEDDQRLVETLAEHVSIALDKQKRFDELEGLREISKTLTSEENLEVLLGKTVEIAKRVLNADIATIFQYDAETDEFYLPVAVGVEEQDFPSKDGMVTRIIREGEVILAEDVSKDIILGESKFIKDRGIKSSAVVPLRYGVVFVGILFVNYTQGFHQFTDYEKMVISILADQAATAINMAGNLFSANQQLETVQNIINAVELHASLPDFLQNILESVLERVRAKSGTIQLYDIGRNGLVIYAKVGHITNQQYQFLALDTGITGKSATLRKAIYAHDTTLFPEYVDFMSDTRSEFAVPMMIGDTLIGILNAEDVKPNAFSPYDRKLLERMASQLAILIRQKQRSQEIEEKRLTEQVNYNLGLVTAEVAHKVGNAAGEIRVIAGENLLLDSQLTKTQKEDVQVILSNVEEMIRATEELFRPFGPEPKADVTIREMLRVAIAQCVIPDNIKMYQDVASSLPKAHIEVTKVQSYLAELLKNAIKYTKKGMNEKKSDHETIEIVGKCSNDGFIEIRITNHGPAIPANRWESIFRVFSASENRERDELSYGLGLWGARTTMQKQGGDVILLESDDAKTTFVVRLPTSQGWQK